MLPPPPLLPLPPPSLLTSLLLLLLPHRHLEPQPVLLSSFHTMPKCLVMLYSCGCGWTQGSMCCCHQVLALGMLEMRSGCASVLNTNLSRGMTSSGEKSR